MSGRIPLKKERISNKIFDLLITRCNWIDVAMGENYGSRFSKKFYIRKEKEMNVHNKEKQPYVTIFALGGIIIVGLKSKEEGDQVYELVIKDIKKVCPNILNELKNAKKKTK